MTSRLKRLQQSLDEQNAAMQQHNVLISRAEMEITKNNALVERKQTQIDQLNKKIDQVTSRFGGVSITMDISVYSFSYGDVNRYHNVEL